MQNVSPLSYPPRASLTHPFGHEHSKIYRLQRGLLLCPCLLSLRLCPANAVKGVRFAPMNSSA